MSKSSITIKSVATPNRVTTHPGEMLSEEFLKSRMAAQTEEQVSYRRLDQRLPVAWL